MSRLVLLILALAWTLSTPVRAQAPAADTTFHAVAYVETTGAGAGAAARALTAYRDASLRLDGCVRVDAFEQIGRPGHFVVLETWRDQKAFDARDAAPRMRLTSVPTRPSALLRRARAGARPRFRWSRTWTWRPIPPWRQC
jgi:quinol monooxygenase YgiN